MTKDLLELQEKVRETGSHLLLDGQNQIHDLRSGAATAEEITERMEASMKYHGTKLDQATTQAYVAGLKHAAFLAHEARNWHFNNSEADAAIGRCVTAITQEIKSLTP